MKKSYVILLFILVAVVIGHQKMIRSLIYYPDKSVTEAELSQLKSLGFEPFEDRGYLRKVSDPKKLVIVFHGNAGNAAQRYYLIEGFVDEHTAIYLAEYPGYGNRPGSPTEDSITAAALDDIQKLKVEFKDVPIYLLGESLGTGVVAEIAQQVGAKGMIMASPFTSLVDVGRIHYPFLPVKLMVPDRFDSVLHLKDSKIPLLIIHGKQDNIVPYVLGEKLYESYHGPKDFLALPGVSHNDLPWHVLNGEIWQMISEWMNPTN